jgi:hypothetical protein
MVDAVGHLNVLVSNGFGYGVRRCWLQQSVFCDWLGAGLATIDLRGRSRYQSRVR